MRNFEQTPRKETCRMWSTSLCIVSIVRSVVPRLHVITDTQLQQQFTHVELAKQIVEGATQTVQTAVQVREKRPQTTRQRVEIAKAITMLCKHNNACAIINDRVDVAIAAQSHGVHLGADDLELSIARQLIPQQLIGATANSKLDVQRVQQHDIDYIGLGPIYPTKSKQNPKPALGLKQLEEIVQLTTLPIIAIGGITKEQIPDVIKAGAYGVAILSSIVCADNPTHATKQCIEAIDKTI